MASHPLFMLALASTLSFGGVGCLAFAPVVDEPLRVTAVDDLSPSELGLREGVSTLDDAREAMTRRGLTGVAEDAFADDLSGEGSTSGRAATLAVLAADYQSRVLVFYGDRFAYALPLPLHGLPPYGMSVRLGRVDASQMLLVLYRDPAGRAELPPTLLGFRAPLLGASNGAPLPGASNGAPAFELVSRTSLGDLATRHEGMTTPMLVGGTMTEGMLLVARDKGGALWDTSYLVRATSSGVSLTPQPMMDALRCSCVRKYALGTSL